MQVYCYYLCRTIFVYNSNIIRIKFEYNTYSIELYSNYIRIIYVFVSNLIRQWYDSGTTVNRVIPIGKARE